jgi:hypothetical protein
LLDLPQQLQMVRPLLQVEGLRCTALPPERFPLTR